MLMAFRVNHGGKSCLRVLSSHDCKTGDRVDVREGNRTTREKLGRIVAVFPDYLIYAIDRRTSCDLARERQEAYERQREKDLAWDAAHA